MTSETTTDRGSTEVRPGPEQIDVSTQHAVLVLGRKMALVRDASGQTYLPLQDLCALLTLDFTQQLKAIQQHRIAGRGLAKGPSDGELEMPWMLSTRSLVIWLCNLTSHDFKDESIRQEVEALQDEATCVLEEAFCEGRLTEQTRVSALLSKDLPIVRAYREAMAVLLLARSQLLVQAGLPHNLLSRQEKTKG